MEITIGPTSDLDPWIGLIGGLLGAVIGAGLTGFITGHYQKKEHNRVDDLRQADILNRQRSAAHRVMVKLIAIYSDISQFHKHLHTEFDKVAAMTDQEPCAVVMPMFIALDAVAFDAEETALFLDIKAAELFNQVGSLPRLHRSLIGTMAEYQVAREAQIQRIPATAFTDDGFRLSLEEYRQLAPEFQRLNDLITGAYYRIDEDLDAAKKGLEAASRVFNEKLETNMRFELLDAQPAPPDT